MTMDNPIFEPAGKNISDNNFMINTFGFIGYIDGMKENDYELIIKKPNLFYGATPLKAEKSDAVSDTYYLNNYDHLADSPILYAVADTAVKMVGGAEVLIGVFSPNNIITAHEIMDNVNEILDAQAKYLGGNYPLINMPFYFILQILPV